MKKNTADQKWRVYAWNRNTNVPATGIAATITATINKDFAGEVATDDANPTEIGGGYYDFALLQAETNAYQLSLKPTTTENGVGVRACPESLSTETPDSVTLAEKLVTMIVLDGAVYDFTAAALAAAPSGSGLSAQEVRDAMKLAPTAGVPAEGSVDKHLDDLVTAVAAVPTAAEIDTQLSGTHGAGTWESSGAGTGARAVTFTVTASAVALQGARVRLYRTGSTDRTGDTDSSGQVTLYCDVDATWSYVVTHPLYSSGSGTVVVDGNEAVPVSLTALSWPDSTEANTVTVRWRVKKADRTYCGAAEGTVYLQIIDGPGTAGFIYHGDNEDFDSETTDANGYVNFANVPIPCTVGVKTGTSRKLKTFEIPSTATSPYDAGELVSHDA